MDAANGGISLRLTEEQHRLIETVRKVTQERFKPDALRYLDGTFPWANLKLLAEIGVAGMTVPEAYGGLGLGTLESALVLEEIAKGCYATAMMMLGEIGVQCRIVSYFAPEPLKQRLLPRIVAGECVMAICITEPDAGTDAGRMRTNADIRGDTVVLNGAKTLISRADVGDLFIVFTRVDRRPGGEGIGCLLVEKGTKGLIAEAKYHTMGGEMLSEVRFEDVEVPIENLDRARERHPAAVQRLQRAAMPQFGDLPRLGGGRVRRVRALYAGARDRRPPDRRVPRAALEAGRHVQGHRGRARPAVSRLRERSGVPRPDAGRARQDPLQRDGDHGDQPRGADARRLRLHRRVPGEPVFPRRPVRRPGRRDAGHAARSGGAAGVRTDRPGDGI